MLPFSHTIIVLRSPRTAVTAEGVVRLRRSPTFQLYQNLENAISANFKNLVKTFINLQEIRLVYKVLVKSATESAKENGKKTSKIVFF